MSSTQSTVSADYWKSTDAYQTFEEALKDLQSAKESLVNASQYQDSAILCNLLTSLAKVVEGVRDTLDDLDTQTMNEDATAERSA